MKKRKTFTFYLFSILLLLFLLEVLIRSFYHFQKKVPFFQPAELYLSHYPELKRVLEDPEINDLSINRVLILGGSAINELICPMDSLLSNHFQNQTTHKKTNIYTLAEFAHNSLDSWYKYEYLKNYHFDYVVFYHGINDTRTNNCPPELFHEAYDHVEFYHELFLLKRHPEINFTILPYFLDYASQWAFIQLGWKKMIPKEYNIMPYFREKKAPKDPWWEYGKVIKSAKTFERNLENVLQLAAEKKETVLLPSYAYYLPENYSLQAFANKTLDYAQGGIPSIGIEHGWPVEIYGDPQNVISGIKTHNSITASLHRKYPQHSRYFDFAAQIPLSSKYFDDVCHPTYEGCHLLFTKIITQMTFE